jgi:hypothetical protein
MDVSIGYYLFSLSEYGDIDLYIITNIISQTSSRLVCNVIYAENGSPRGGQPYTGSQILSGVSSNGIPYLPSYTADQFSEYSQNASRNLIMDMLISIIGPKWSHWPALTNVNLGNNSIYGAQGIQLGGEYRTNWPSVVDVFSTNNSYTYNITTTQTFDNAAANQIVYTKKNVQYLTSNDIITPFANTRICSVAGRISLTNTLQIVTNNIADGTIIIINGFSDANAIELQNGRGIQLDCNQKFLIGRNDTIKFMFNEGVWYELLRQDR